MQHVIRFELEATRYLFYRRKAWAMEARLVRGEGGTIKLITETSFSKTPTIAGYREYELDPGDPLHLQIHRTSRENDNIVVSVETVNEVDVLLSLTLPNGVEFEPVEDDYDVAAG